MNIKYFFEVCLSFDVSFEFCLAISVMVGNVSQVGKLKMSPGLMNKIYIESRFILHLNS